ncbi:cytochrome P450 [Phanerochaete sordida]|uniref:Cytochrome P450 n=1 Tax=Phanerochaete sordida TaxID=48140 RepID=A0A9P3GKK8_9APHY|nr:cytochrome P450 [Phanerochaete sordida]
MDRSPLHHVPLPSLLVGIVLTCLLAVLFRPRRRYPPGPKGLPVIGNIFDMPRKHAWVENRDIALDYGSDVIHYEVLGTHFVVLNSAASVQDLLEKRSSVYSDRHETVMINELTGWGRAIPFMQHNDEWREHRKLIQQDFRPTRASQYNPQQTKAVRRLLLSLLDSPHYFEEHLRFMANATILDVLYALDVDPDDPLITTVDEALGALMKISSSVFIVDIFPVLARLPSWLPGAGFKRQAARWKTFVEAMFDQPYARYKESTLTEASRPCFAANLLPTFDAAADSAGREEVFKTLAGTAFVGTSDTIPATLSAFVLAMTIFPEAQVAAQEELDKLLDMKRLPEIQDREALPQVTAIVYEALRWHPAGPMVLPHRLTTDDEYRGYHLPAGTVVFGNAWAILHDEHAYPNPEQFNPARWLTAAGTLRADMPCPTAGFGFGRRICPGRHFALDVLWLAIAHVLAVLRVERARDADGNEVVPQARFTPWLISTPEPFQCEFRPRFEGAEILIRSGAASD